MACLWIAIESSIRQRTNSRENASDRPAPVLCSAGSCGLSESLLLGGVNKKWVEEGLRTVSTRATYRRHAALRALRTALAWDNINNQRALAPTESPSRHTVAGGRQCLRRAMEALGENRLCWGYPDGAKRALGYGSSIRRGRRRDLHPFS